ncbi:MAG: hypothetical protein RMH81_06475, partial [Thermomicrobium sp.]|nr:hypothetical protein [Thermomicrobium sp.]
MVQSPVRAEQEDRTTDIRRLVLDESTQQFQHLAQRRGFGDQPQKGRLCDEQFFRPLAVSHVHQQPVPVERTTLGIAHHQGTVLQPDPATVLALESEGRLERLSRLVGPYRLGVDTRLVVRMHASEPETRDLLELLPAEAGHLS